MPGPQPQQATPTPPPIDFSSIGGSAVSSAAPIDFSSIGGKPAPTVQKITRKPGMDANQLRAGGWTTEDLQKGGFGAAALADENNPISSGEEQPVEKMMSPASQRQATKGGMAFGSMIPAAFIPGSWPLIGKAVAAGVVGGATGAAQSAVDEHPSGRDMLHNMGTQAGVYAGGELTGGLLSKAFNFLRSLRGVSQAAKAAAGEAETVSAANAAQPQGPTPPANVPGSPGTFTKPIMSEAQARPAVAEVYQNVVDHDNALLQANDALKTEKMPWLKREQLVAHRNSFQKQLDALTPQPVTQPSTGSYTASGLPRTGPTPPAELTPATPVASSAATPNAKPTVVAPQSSTPAPLTPTPKPAGDIIGERLGILDKDPQSLMTSALKPGTNNSKWAADLQKAFPDLKAAEAELGHPIATFDDAKAAVKTAKSRLWDQFTSKLGAAGQAGATIDGNKVADAMMGSIDARTAAQNPGLVDRITKVAETYRRPMPVEEAEEYLESANNELNSYYAKNKVGQQVAAGDPEVGHVVNEANELRNQLYSKLDEVTGPGARDLKQRYGALSNFQDVLSKRENVALRQQPQSLAEQISKARAYAKIAVGTARMDPWTVYEGVQQSAAATWLKERQTSEAMMERGFANYGRPSAPAVSTVSPPSIPKLGSAARAATEQSSQQQQ